MFLSVMVVSSVDTLDFRSIGQHLLLLASQLLNIILSFLMIFCTILGLFSLRLKSVTFSTIT
jgi:hypothetical protein